MLHAAPRKGIRDSGARNKSGQTGCELNVESGRIIVFIFFAHLKVSLESPLRVFRIPCFASHSLAVLWVQSRGPFALSALFDLCRLLSRSVPTWCVLLLDS